VIAVKNPQHRLLDEQREYRLDKVRVGHGGAAMLLPGQNVGEHNCDDERCCG
jgi:hypothetical protein